LQLRALLQAASFNTEDPEGSFTELSRGGVEFYEAAYDGELIYGLDTDNNFYSVNPAIASIAASSFFIVFILFLHVCCCRA